MKATPLLAALLMLGGVSLAYAQGTDYPGASESGSKAQERGSGPDAGASGRSNKNESSNEEERRSEKSTNASEGSSSKSADQKAAGQERPSPSKNADRDDSGNKSAKSQNDEGAGLSRMSEEKSRTEKGTETGKRSSQQTDSNGGESGKGDATPRAAQDNAAAGKAKQVDLSGDKRSKVQTAFRDAGNVKRRTNVDISISIGRRLPRDWDFVAIPESVVAIVPEYRGYRFAYVDDEYVLVEPDTYEVVAMIPAERSTATSAGTGRGQYSEQLSLDRRERELILDNVRGGGEADIPDLSVGSQVPRDVELLVFPSSVTSEASELEACKYFAAGATIAIVDPKKETIVAVIDKKS